MKSLSTKINESLNEAKVSFEDVIGKFKDNGFIVTKVKGTNNTYDIAKKNYAKTKGTIEKYGDKTVLNWGHDYQEDVIDNSDLLFIITTLVNESAVNESPSHPMKIEIVNRLYLHIDRNNPRNTGWFLNKPSGRDNGSLKKGEVYVFSHEYDPKNGQPVGLNFNDENGHDGPEFTANELETLIRNGAIKEIFGFTK